MTFILDRPRDVVNVGAVVRLMGNFGLRHLRLVEPAAFDPERILTIARRGHSVLSAVQRYPDVQTALADCTFVLAATSRQRAQRQPLLTPRQAAPALLAVAESCLGLGESQPPLFAAVLFGPENFGLSNEAVNRCNAILTIPTVPEDASLNVAQAALLVAYELHLLSNDHAESPLAFGDEPTLGAFLHGGDLATNADVEALIAAFTRLLGSLHGELMKGRTNALNSRFRAMLLRSLPGADEVAALTQVFEHAARQAAASRAQP